MSWKKAVTQSYVVKSPNNNLWYIFNLSASETDALAYMSTHFLWAWKEAYVKPLPLYSPKNLLSHSRMW